MAVNFMPDAETLVFQKMSVYAIYLIKPLTIVRGVGTSVKYIHAENKRKKETLPLTMDLYSSL
jgi:hypothetical protein